MILCLRLNIPKYPRLSTVIQYYLNISIFNLKQIHTQRKILEQIKQYKKNL